ncbi:MAG: zf-HC2 domain-containing protein [Nitrospirota bacterium]
MDNYDNILKKLIKTDYQRPANMSDCLSEEMLAAYLDNLLSGVDKEKVEGHLTSCKVCLKKSIVQHRIMKEVAKEETLKAPLEVTLRAKKLKGQSKIENLVEVVLAFAKDNIRVLRDSGTLIRPLELVLEGGRQSSTKEQNNVVYLQKQFDGVKAEVLIEKIDNLNCDIEVKTIDVLSGKLIDNIRINLALDDRELASFLSVNGKVSYKNVSPGSYALIFVHQGNVLGKILLRLEVE